MNKTLEAYCKALSVKPINEDRLPVLQALVDYGKSKSSLQLNFICTHNSRRSQFAQVWAQIAAHYYGVSCTSFSGGVEVTACNPRTIAALERCGISVQKMEADSSNPLYQVAFAADAPNVELFSKLYDHPANPTSNFAALMTCSDADENCPFIPGTEARIALNYRDPKEFDDSPQEREAYDERCAQIAAEMFYVFKSIKHGQ